MPLIIGLTGGIGSGKSEASKQFAALGAPIVDVDVIAHQLTAAGEPLVAVIADTLGQQYVDAAGVLDRAALRHAVFGDAQLRHQLEAILHPAIHQQALLELAQNTQAPYQILAIPLLLEGQRYQSVVNRILVIDCAESLQISRARMRSGLSEEAVRAVMANQVSRATRISHADDIVVNEGNLSELAEKIEQLHKKYIAACVRRE